MLHTSRRMPLKFSKFAKNAKLYRISALKIISGLETCNVSGMLSIEVFDNEKRSSCKQIYENLLALAQLCKTKRQRSLCY